MNSSLKSKKFEDIHKDLHIPDIQRHLVANKDEITPMSSDREVQITHIPKINTKNLNTDLEVLHDSTIEESDDEVKESALFAKEFIRKRNLKDLLFYNNAKFRRNNPVLSKIHRNLRYSRRNNLDLTKSLNRSEKLQNKQIGSHFENSRNGYHVFLSQNRNANIRNSSKNLEDSIEIVKRNKEMFEHYNWNIANFINK